MSGSIHSPNPDGAQAAGCIDLVPIVCRSFVNCQSLACCESF